jgi:hypothetical protein
MRAIHLILVLYNKVVVRDKIYELLATTSTCDGSATATQYGDWPRTHDKE